MEMQVGYVSVTPAQLKRFDLPYEKAFKTGLPPNCLLEGN
jgi:hypothetical protein